MCLPQCLVDTGGKDFKLVPMGNLVNDKFKYAKPFMFRINYSNFEVAYYVSSIKAHSAGEGVYIGGN